MNDLEIAIRRKINKKSLNDWLDVMYDRKRILLDEDDDDDENRKESIEPEPEPAIPVSIGIAPVIPLMGKLTHQSPPQFSIRVKPPQPLTSNVEGRGALVFSTPKPVKERGKLVFTVKKEETRARSFHHVIDYDAHVRAERDEAQHQAWLAERNEHTIEEYDAIDRRANNRQLIDYDTLAADFKEQTWQWLLDD
jgi:hypothetical protein